jgi:hypothetical protein
MREGVRARFEAFVVLSRDESLDVLGVLEEAAEYLRGDAPATIELLLLSAADVVRGKLLGGE